MTPTGAHIGGQSAHGAETEIVPTNRRILVIDDNPRIHDDFRTILVRADDGIDVLLDMEAELFGERETRAAHDVSFEVDSAYQGREGLEMVTRALHAGQPYAMAFVDVRMPPGWDGIETINRIWEVDPDVQVVICTAYSDYSWEETVEILNPCERFLILKKPFDTVVVRQLAHALTEKWHLTQAAKQQLGQLRTEVDEKSRSLDQAQDQIAEEVARRQQMEVELRHAQKLEAVGQLAAGIAHEINTPIQFVGDSVHFLRESFTDLNNLLAIYQQLLGRSGVEDDHEELLREARDAEQQADLDYLMDQIPKAVERTLDGIERVATIVRAMKEFAHPSAATQDDADINKALLTTLTVARNEYKYVATVTTDLGDLPPVRCYLSDLNQVFLNLVVNAAHAIHDVVGDTEEKGRIVLSSRVDGDHVIIDVSDSGTGIPAEIADRVFEPFFTTKEVGRGTGQGLAIARSIVVDKHRGSIWFDTARGKGTTFHIRLPISGKDAS